jgi:hypothetical protein
MLKGRLVWVYFGVLSPYAPSPHVQAAGLE